ncbi:MULTISPECIES: hypothetical protein [Clostridium]|uniref:Uncharacterized protein n=2 Tax=Clostridium TaxID=1485 RepID=A0A151AKE7_9CLOT|nr:MULTISPECIES: hypothetical protein [Clostridium]KYH28010.1 hypothetical protein CLCOL_23710 [Clostridium colicanis DSM 13634]PRR76521.1 hypothetical protein CPAL_01920 [Clostridium thermopalmarium DSM 5974]PVZ28366.1 hypothetical protein LX19_00338 [Clostridium thermopalmarium DSM 5974]
MNNQKKRKLSIIVIAVVTIAMISSIFLTQLGSIKQRNTKEQTKQSETSKEQSKEQSKETNAKGDSTQKTAQDKEFRVLWAFADIDKDFMIQAKDSSDGDTSADYIFMKFTDEVLDDKSASSALQVSNYKLDGQPLPKGTVITPEIKGYDDSTLKDKLTIKLPNGYLKGVNAPHTLEISNNIKSKRGKAISGDLKLSLSYSKSEAKAQAEANGKNGTANNATANKGMPKYTVEIGKNLPYSTLVAVYLDTKTPENYKVSVGSDVLELRQKKTGEKVFINVINKDYTQDEVNSLIKIEKVK